MNLKQFLIARTAEELAARSCLFEVENDDQLRCLCRARSSEIEELFAQLRLISQWNEHPDGHSMLKLLASKYATHEEYEAEWISAQPQQPDAR